MKYLDMYPDCKGCPVKQCCGTMIQSTRLCNSYNEKYLKQGIALLPKLQKL